MVARKTKTARTRRVFSAEFKLEAVQRADERRATGVPLTQIARELGVTDALLRAMEAAGGGAARRGRSGCVSRTWEAAR